MSMFRRKLVATDEQVEMALEAIINFPLQFVGRKLSGPFHDWYFISMSSNMDAEGDTHTVTFRSTPHV